MPLRAGPGRRAHPRGPDGRRAPAHAPARAPGRGRRLRELRDEQWLVTCDSSTCQDHLIVRARVGGGGHLPDHPLRVRRLPDAARPHGVGHGRRDRPVAGGAERARPTSRSGRSPAIRPSATSPSRAARARPTWPSRRRSTRCASPAGACRWASSRRPRPRRRRLTPRDAAHAAAQGRGRGHRARTARCCGSPTRSCRRRSRSGGCRRGS